MNILLVYGTTEGQTRKIAEFIAKRFRGMGDAVTLADATADSIAVDVRVHDAAILAGSLHAGEYQRPLAHFARANHAWLNLMPGAFVSVSLSAAGNDHEELKGIAECAERFKQTTGWTTPEVHQVAGAFRFTEYDFFKRWLMKLIAWDKGITVEPGKDLELTNWDALSATIDAMRARFAGVKTKMTA